MMKKKIFKYGGILLGLVLVAYGLWHLHVTQGLFTPVQIEIPLGQTLEKPLPQEKTIDVAPPPQKFVDKAEPKNDKKRNVSQMIDRAKKHYGKNGRPALMNTTPWPEIPLAGPTISLLAFPMNTQSPLWKRMPYPVALAIHPQLKEGPDLVRMARQEGHECFLQIPMEPQSFDQSDPGPDPLMVKANNKENIQRLSRHVHRFKAITGIMPLRDSPLTASHEKFGGVLDWIHGQHLGYVDFGASMNSLAQSLCAQKGIPFLNLGISLGHQGGVVTQESLVALEEKAKKNGWTWAYFDLTKENAEIIGFWLETLNEKGVRIVPMSVAMTRQKK